MKLIKTKYSRKIGNSKWEFEYVKIENYNTQLWDERIVGAMRFFKGIDANEILEGRKLTSTRNDGLERTVWELVDDVELETVLEYNRRQESK